MNRAMAGYIALFFLIYTIDKFAEQTKCMLLSASDTGWGIEASISSQNGEIPYRE